MTDDIGKKKSVWSLISFACPICTVALLYFLGRGIKDEELGMRAAGVGAYSFLALAIAALIGAFVRRERMKWLTLLPVLLLLALLTLGYSVSVSTSVP